MFSHWIAHEANPGSISRGVITMLEKRGSNVWEKQDDYQPITLLNTELKNFAWILANHLLIVVGDLIGPELNYIVKGRSIQNNLHLMCEIREGIEDDMNTVLISLNQYKAFNRVEYQLMVTTKFEAEFCFLSAVIWCSWVNI